MSAILYGFGIGFAMLLTHFYLFARGLDLGFRKGVDAANQALLQYQLQLLKEQQQNPQEKKVDLEVN